MIILERILNRLSRHLDLERQERALVAQMGLLVALLLAGYTIAKVLRDSLFISEFGARALPYGYVAVALASVGLVKLQPIVARYLPRVSVVTFSQVLAIACSVAAALVFPLERQWLPAAFYIWAGSQGMMLVAQFWMMALEVCDARRARRLFPVLAGCGLAGGVAGGAFANIATPYLGIGGLLWGLSGVLVLVRGLTANLSAQRRFKSLALSSVGESRLGLIVRSPLLRYLVASIGLSVISSTLVDFQFKQLAQEFYPDRQSLTRFLGAFHAGLDGFAMLAQFGVAGWILRNAGLGAAAALQPATVLAFSGWMLMSSSWTIVLVLRWIQGVIFQAVGKSGAEIYYMPIHPVERRRVKPAVDLLVERGADALVGVVLVVLLHVVGVPFKFLAALTAVIAVVWILVQFGLHREYTRSFRDSLARRWVDPGEGGESLRMPAVRRALVEAMQSGNDRQVVVALEFCRGGSYEDTDQAVRGCLGHSSPHVRAAAVQTMAALSMGDPDGVIRSFLIEKDDQLRRAAVEYLVSQGGDPTSFIRGLLEGNDRTLWRYVLDVLASRPELAPGAVTLAWIDERFESGAVEDLEVAGVALGTFRGPEAVQRLRLLLGHNNRDVQRSALRSAALRPAPELMDSILPLLFVPDLPYETREALAALGDAALPSLETLVLWGENPVIRMAAAHVLARIGTRRAIAILLSLIRNQDPATRYLGLRNLNRTRRDLGQPVVPRGLAHRMFLRELRDYRSSTDRAVILEGFEEPEIGLLADSFRESADRALHRALRALACWYDPAPLEGAYNRLRSGERDAMARGLEFIGGILPRKIFGSVTVLFESGRAREREEIPSNREMVVQSIQRAWEGGDAWLRACAIRAARRVPGMNLSEFRATDADDPMVVAELQSLAFAFAEQSVGGGPAGDMGGT